MKRQQVKKKTECNILINLKNCDPFEIIVVLSGAAVDSAGIVDRESRCGLKGLRVYKKFDLHEIWKLGGKIYLANQNWTLRKSAKFLLHYLFFHVIQSIQTRSHSF